MAEIKRLNYFTSQFLVEKDFKDEQAYHIQVRRQHNRALHSAGIVEGLNVTKTGDKQVTVGSGIAIDKDGKEIVVSAEPAPTPIDLTRFGANTSVFLTISYQEVFDPSDRYQSEGIDNFTRATERPKLDVTTTAPPRDVAAIALARIPLDASGNVGAIDTAIRTFASAAIAPGAINSIHLASNSVTLDKIAASIRPIVSIDGVNNPGGNVDLVSTNAITINPDNTNKRITIGENHSGRTDNPHATTAAQIGALPLAGGTLTGALTVSGSVGISSGLTVGGNVGIGITPAFQLDIGGRMRIRQTATGQPTAGLWLSGYYAREFDAAFVGMRTVNEVGFYGNTGTANWRLWVDTTNGTLNVTGQAFKPGGGAWGSSSDERLKNNIQPLPNALEQLIKLRGVTYEWKEPEKQGNLTGTQIGLIAQEVEPVFPDWVGVDADGYKTLSIRGFEALAIEAFRTLKAENEHLKQRCNDLEAKLENLLNQLQVTV